MMAQQKELSIVIVDSGMGGLSICADIAEGFSVKRSHRRVEITYFNAWPDQDRGYNRLPDDRERVRVFDAALTTIDSLKPDLLLIACNPFNVLAICSSSSSAFFFGLPSFSKIFTSVEESNVIGLTELMISCVRTRISFCHDSSSCSSSSFLIFWNEISFICFSYILNSAARIDNHRISLSFKTFTNS